jgi:hypothetical protein
MTLFCDFPAQGLSPLNRAQSSPADRSCTLISRYRAFSPRSGMPGTGRLPRITPPSRIAADTGGGRS